MCWLGELVEVRQRDIELAHRPERARHAPHLPAHAAEAMLMDRDAQDWQRFAQAPGRDARLMHRSHVARLRRRHRVDECRQPLIHQQRAERLCCPCYDARSAAQYTVRALMRLAAIDIGTNSVHMIVVQVRPDFSFEVIDREKEMVRLGAGGLDGKKLTTEAMTSALQALSKFERLARSYQVDEILAAATSATREAENGGEFLPAIERTTGIRPRIITGTKEARLIHLAAVYGVDTPKKAVVIDIGGGSVEITLGTGQQVQFARSFKIGVIRLTERFVTSDPLSGRDERKMVRHIREQIEPLHRARRRSGLRSGHRHLRDDSVDRNRGDRDRARQRAVRDAQPARRRPRASAGSARLARRWTSKIGSDARARSAARRPHGRRRGPARHDPSRAQCRGDHAVRSRAARGTGARLHPASTARRSPASIGIPTSAAARRSSSASAATGKRPTPSRSRGWRSPCSTGRSACTASAIGEREWLEYASLLHDIGNHISYERHNRHSYYLIKNGDLRGFEPEEIEVMALLARYHRRGLPAEVRCGLQDSAGGLRKTVRILSGVPPDGRRRWIAAVTASSGR